VVIQTVAGGASPSPSLSSGGTNIDSGYSRTDRACGLDALAAGNYLIQIQAAYFSSSMFAYDATPTASLTPTATVTPTGASLVTPTPTVSPVPSQPHQHRAPVTHLPSPHLHRQRPHRWLRV